MKKMKLAVFTVEEDYAAAVARGIAGYARRVDIRICATRLEAEKAASEMVLLTDVAELREIKNAVYMSGVCTADMLIDMAAEKWYEISGEVFVPERDGTRIWALYTRQGGCGVTSAALAAAWVLSRDEQNRVLYLNLGPYDDYRDYTESDFEKTEQKRKLLYFISFMKKRSRRCRISQGTAEEYGISDRKRSTTALLIRQSGILLPAISENAVFSLML